MEDAYKVPLGSQLQITNLSEGLLGNDYDPDGDTITYNGPAVVTTTNSATVQVNSDGTFTYNFGPNLALLSIGDTDTFTYTIVDSTGRESDTINPATVTITYEASAYQNPIAGLREDVNADGFVTPLDALVVINFLEAQGSASVPVSLIGSAPPDYLDTTGNGLVTPQDALDVIDVLALLGGGSGEGEFASQLRTQQIPAQLGTTTSFAAVNRSGLPIRAIEQVTDRQSDSDDGFVTPLDQLLANGLEFNAASLDSAVAAVDSSELSEAASADQVDEVLASVLDEMDVALPVE